MSEEISLLCGSLSKQLDFYKQILDLAKQETNCLLTHDVKGLNAIIKSKEGILLKIKEQESLRGIFIKRLAQMFNLSGGILNLAKLKEMIDYANSAELEKIQSELREVSRELAEINSRNAVLIENVLIYTRDMIRIFVASKNKDVAYNKRGALEIANNRLCDRRV